MPLQWLKRTLEFRVQVPCVRKTLLHTLFPFHVYENMEGKQNCHIRDRWHCSVKIMPILYSKIELSKECTHFCGLCQEFVPLQLHCNAMYIFTEHLYTVFSVQFKFIVGFFLTQGNLKLFALSKCYCKIIGINTNNDV